MADIAMCKGTMCPKKETCYRFTAPVNEYRQSFFVTPPINMLTKECNKYWEIKDGKY